MKYVWKITPEINQLLIRLEVLKISLENTKSLPHPDAKKYLISLPITHFLLLILSVDVSYL